MPCCIDHNSFTRWTTRFACLAALTLAACSSVRPPQSGSPDTLSRSSRSAPPRETGSAALPAAGSGRGGYYLDDGPGEAPPANLLAIPDAEPKIEPYSIRGNKPYVVFGKTYTPVTDGSPLTQRGVGSWYGKKFHGQKTSSGELYDMYKMTAAHPTLPIPSYARVTNLRNGVQVIVRVNDRGPFHSKRIIDLSYTAALKLGYLAHGSSELEVERLLPDDIARINSGERKSVTAAVPPPAGLVPTPTPIPVPVPVAVPIAAATQSIDDFLGVQGNALAESVAPVTLPMTTLPAMPGLVGTNGSSVPALAAALLTASTPPITVAGEAPSPALAPGGFYLQFGAFSRSGNAETSRQRLAQQWPLTLPALEVRQNGAVYQVYSGPFASRNEAVAAARSLPDNPAARPMIVQR